MTIGRSMEADAFLAAIDSAPPEAVSACEGWTTHEIAAHVTGIAVEVIRHLEPYLRGEPVPKTRRFEEREAPLQALGHLDLLRGLDSEEDAKTGSRRRGVDREPDAVLPWTGRHMAVAKFIPHLRNEHALHRWDVAGDDDISRQLLGGDDLVDHSVGELGRLLLIAGRKHDLIRTPTSGYACAVTGVGTYKCSSRPGSRASPGPTATWMDPYRHRPRGASRLHLGPTT